MSGGFYTRAEIKQAMDMMVGERLPGQEDQSVYEQSAVQKFLIGAKRKVDDGTFRYSQALAAWPPWPGWWSTPTSSPAAPAT